MAENMKQNMMKVYLFIKYVDDVNLFIEGVKLGSRWIGKDENKVVQREEWEEEDRREGRTI